MFFFFFEDLRLIIAYDFEDLSVFITYDFEDLSLTIVLNVVAAGSLLEFAIAEVADIPVGRVRNIFVYPFSFAEFVSALGGDINAKDNKFMLFDTGLYLYEIGLNLSEWINDPPQKFVNRGKLAEMFVAHELKKSGTPLEDNPLYYWHRDNKNGKAEVDFVVQYKNAPLPIEVKSGVKGSMKSLRILMDEKSFSLGIRASEENFGSLDEGRIQIVPMYFIGEYEAILNHKV